MARTCLYSSHQNHGATIVDFHGWDMPIRYSTIPAEHQQVRESAGLFDLCHMGRLQVSGPDAEAWVESLVTLDVSKLALGSARYGFVCNEEGGILDDLIVYRLQDRLFIVVNASNREKVIAWFEKHKNGRNAELKDLSSELAMIAIQGPNSNEILSSGLGIDLKLLEEMAYYKISEGEILGTQGLLATTGYTGERGFEIFLPNEKAVEAWETLLKSAGPRLAPIGLGARDTLRVEAGMPLYGQELSESLSPYDAGLGPVVKLDKGEFMGSTRLKAIKEQGASRKLVGVKIESKRIARTGMKVLQGEREIGEVTSGIPSPTLGHPVALISVTSDTDSSEDLFVDIRGKITPITPVALPFFSNTRKQASKAL